MEWWRIQGELWRVAGPAVLALARGDMHEFEYLTETVAEPIRQRRDALKERRSR
jgi:hypothetical protein